MMWGGGCRHWGLVWQFEKVGVVRSRSMVVSLSGTSIVKHLSGSHRLTSCLWLRTVGLVNRC